jgi:hypothetical protein
MTRNVYSRSRAHAVRENVPLEQGNHSTPAWSRRVRLLPILFFQAYLGFTVILFRWGPWPWPVRDGTKLYTYLLLVHLSLFFGYLSAANKDVRASSRRPRFLKILVLSLIVNVAMLLPTVIARAPEGAFDIAAAIADPGSAYVAAREWRQTSLFSLAVSYIRIFLSPLLVALFPLTVFYRQQLGRPLLVLSFAFILASPLLSIATGTNKAVFDFILVTAWIALAAHLSGIGRVSVVRRTFLLGIVAVLFLFAFWFFTQGMLTRPGASAVYFSRTRTFADVENIFVRWLPGEARTGALALASYLTQGYYALYLALQLPFVPTFGVGNSFFLLRNVVRLTGFARLEAMPYPMRVESTYGWSASGNWSTIYPWLASDVSFPGTLIVVFLVGRLLAVTWLDSLQGRNPWAVVLFSQLVIMLFYFPANNQILQSGESLFAFIVTLFLWLRSRHMPRYPRSNVLRTTMAVQLERARRVH